MWTKAKQRNGIVRMGREINEPRALFVRALRRAVAGAALAAVPAFGGCSSESVGPPPAPPVNWQSLAPKPIADAGPVGPTALERQLAEFYASALGSGGSVQGDAGGPADRIASLAAHLDDDARLTFPGWQDVHGRDPVVHAHELLYGPFDRRSMTLTRVWRTPASQALEWTMTGVQSRDWMGVPATGRPVTMSGLTILATGDEGTIADVRVYFDVTAVRSQLGVAAPKELPAPPTSAPPGTAPPLGGDAALSGDSASAASPPIVDQTGNPAEAMVVAVARSALDALETNREGDYVDAMADDVEIHAPGRAAPARGKADARAYFRALRKAIGQLDTTVTNAAGAGAFAVVEYTIAGVQLGPVFGVPTPRQRDNAFRVHLVDVVEQQDGKIRRVWTYGNPAELLAPLPE